MALGLFGTSVLANSVVAPTTSEKLGEISKSEKTITSYQETIATKEELKLYLAQLSANTEQFELLNRVINCESGFDNSRIGLAGEIGLAQFKQGTWDYFNRLRGTKLNIHNPYEQIEMIVYAFNNGLENHWTCFSGKY